MKAFINIFFLIIISVLLALFAYSKIIENNRNLTEILIDNRIKIKAEIADSPLKWKRGLGGRKILETRKGMLFVFPKNSYQSFWMKNMKFPLDIIWIDDGLIIDIDKNVDFKNQKKIYSPPQPVDYVLEVNAGFSDENNIKIGERIEIRK